MTSPRETIDYRQASIETAHEAALAEEPLLDEAKWLWNRYFNGIADSDCMADLVEDNPARANEKLETADKISREILERELR